MLTTDAALYLPISHRTLCQVLDDDAESLEKAVSSLSVPQVAALVLLQYMPKLTEKRSLPPERLLAEVIETRNAQMKRDGLAAVMADILPELNRPKIEEGYQLLPDFGIALLDEETLEHRSYLNAEGNWDYGFRERHRAQLMESLVHVNIPTGEIRALTAEQSRIYREVKAQADDHMHVQPRKSS